MWLFVTANRLNEYISHYEAAEYDHRDLHTAHSRAKRSVTQNHVVHLALKALGRSLNIRLKRDLSTFSDQLSVVDHSDRPIPAVSTSHVYEGHLLGQYYQLLTTPLCCSSTLLLTTRACITTVVLFTTLLRIMLKRKQVTVYCIC